MGNIRFFYKGLKVDDRTRDYIEKRMNALDRMLKSMSEDQVRAEVEIEVDKKGKYRVEIIINTPIKLFRSAQTSESIEGSADIAQEEIKRQIKEEKGRIDTLRMRGARSIKKKTVLDGNARF